MFCLKRICIYFKETNPKASNEKQRSTWIQFGTGHRGFQIRAKCTGYENQEEYLLPVEIFIFK